MRIDSAFADRVTALVLFVIGAAASYGGFTMDRLEIRRIHPASFPGLVPIILGIALMLCAVALAWSAHTQKAEGDTEGSLQPVAVSWRNFAVVTLWSALFALAAIGHVPFTVASGTYIAGFTLFFIWAESDDGRAPGILTVLAVIVFAAVIAIAISVLFRYGFLVRLP